VRDVLAPEAEVRVRAMLLYLFGDYRAMPKVTKVISCSFRAIDAVACVVQQVQAPSIEGACQSCEQVRLCRYKTSRVIAFVYWHCAERSAG
jgi:hypothetical protein